MFHRKPAPVTAIISPQEIHQHEVLRDFQRAVVEQERAGEVLTTANRIAKLANEKVNETRRRLRRVAEGGI